MNEQLQSKLVEILTSMQAAAKAAGDFALEQLPDIAQQYIAYGRVVGTLGAIACVAIFCLSVWVFIHHGLMSNKKDSWGLSAGSKDAAIAIGGACSVLSGMATAFTVGNAALVWFAPKVWLLKELAQMVKS